jgi:hypothetical protein
VTFASSPVKARHISPQNEDSVDNGIFDSDDDDDHDTESESEFFFLWDEESTLLDELMDRS